uniref:MADS-box domain-containing protein n=1 Tax=Megaselia scalaris TaxID=36166 RepID=T1GWC8_MEGSC
MTKRAAEIDTNKSTQIRHRRCRKNIIKRSFSDATLCGVEILNLVWGLSQIASLRHKFNDSYDGCHWFVL